MVCGILLLDKPRGVSSNAALQRVRRLLRADKAGHVGSLDPLATGMLPVCLGEATKIAGDILSGRKRYRFTVALGSRTATGDSEGAVVESLPVPVFDEAALEAVLQRFRGRTTQIPPMYSAIKRDGQPLYKLARAGMEVERKPRDIEVDELRVVGRGAPPARDASDAAAPPDGAQMRLELEALCSKGTYIRVLAEDIARALGTCGHVVELRRLAVEPFDPAAMQTMEDVTARAERGEPPVLVAPDLAIPHLPPVRLSAADAARVLHGQAVATPVELPPGRVRLYDAEGRFFGIGEADGFGRVQPRRLFVMAS
ncbi:MAG TPA: tRNA pseudouridine(55) synthase TruB [Steroidobacteraceae bacterium]|nr:tRNA pseudouridine(55) synthase TruB [Steroidobacteraceae bacterium]